MGLRCGLCFEHSKRLKYSEKWADIAKEEGILHATESENLVAISHHDSKSKQHALVMGELTHRTLDDLMMDDYQLSVGNYDDGRYGVTMTLLRLAYTEAKLGVRFCCCT